jgi:hypothetical protein
MHRTISAARYIWLIERLGLNQTTAANFLGVSSRQSRRYVAADRKVDPAAAMLLELMVLRGITVEEALRLIGGARRARMKQE